MDSTASGPGPLLPLRRRRVPDASRVCLLCSRPGSVPHRSHFLYHDFRALWRLPQGECILSDPCDPCHHGNHHGAGAHIQVRGHHQVSRIRLWLHAPLRFHVRILGRDQPQEDHILVCRTGRPPLPLQRLHGRLEKPAGAQFPRHGLLDHVNLCERRVPYRHFHSEKQQIENFPYNNENELKNKKKKNSKSKKNNKLEFDKINLIKESEKEMLKEIDFLKKEIQLKNNIIEKLIEENKNLVEKIKIKEIELFNSKNKAENLARVIQENNKCIIFIVRI